MSDTKLPIDATYGMSDPEVGEFDSVSATMVKHLEQLDELDSSRIAPTAMEAIPALGLLSARQLVDTTVVSVDFSRRQRLH